MSRLGWFVTVASLVVLTCGSSEDVPVPEAPAPLPRYTGDMDTILQKGVLRVIVRPDPLPFMPRKAEPVSIDRDMARGLAADLALDLQFVVANDYGAMIEMLKSGQGDVIAAGLTATPTRAKEISFSVPYLFVDEMLVTVAQDSLPGDPTDLNRFEVAVRRASSYAETARELQKEYPGLQVRELPETLNTEEIVEQVAEGEIPATITDSNYWEAVSRNFDNLRAPLVVANERPVVLGIRKESTDFKEKVDEFLHARALTRDMNATFTGDLPELRERGRLRMITRNNAVTYFIHRGRQIGFEYELMEKFAAQQNLRLAIVIPPNHDEVLEYLDEGKGDIVASAMTVTPERLARASFSDPYLALEELVVVRSVDESISRPEDLAGRTVHLRASSSFFTSLRELQRTVAGINIVVLPEDMETEEILAGVESGSYDITVSDSNLLQVEQAYGRELKSAFSLKPANLGWAVRKDAPELLAALNRFLDAEYRGLFYNMVKRRYFQNRRNIGRALDSLRTHISGTISPYDETVKQYAANYAIDWRLVVAQMYQESRFDPSAESWVGAQGLMQIMPATARELGVGDITKPEPAIHGGIKYLRSMADRFSRSIPLDERFRFALAAYNAGYGHVLDARRLTSRNGLDPDKWFGNVETGMLMLEKPRYYDSARYGYCRGSEPVAYVRSIQDRYEAYVSVLNTSSSE